jgi:hypothetical protein
MTLDNTVGGRCRVIALTAHVFVCNERRLFYLLLGPHNYRIGVVAIVVQINHKLARYAGAHSRGIAQDGEFFVLIYGTVLYIIGQDFQQHLTGELAYKAFGLQESGHFVGRA